MKIVALLTLICSAVAAFSWPFHSTNSKEHQEDAVGKIAHGKEYPHHYPSKPTVTVTVMPAVTVYVDGCPCFPTPTPTPYPDDDCQEYVFP
jgi:hypothetical protein